MPKKKEESPIEGAETTETKTADTVRLKGIAVHKGVKARVIEAGKGSHLLSECECEVLRYESGADILDDGTCKIGAMEWVPTL